MFENHIRPMRQVIKTASLLFVTTFYILLTLLPAQLEAQSSESTKTPEELYKQARTLVSTDGDVKLAFQLMNQAAETGHAEAIGAVGYFHYNGITVSKDEEEAASWFRRGAEKGGARAQLNWGRMLIDGRGGQTQDVEKGLAWIRKSATQGLPDAVLFLGNTHFFGDHNQPVNYDEAYSYFLAEAEKGNPKAQTFIGTMINAGYGHPKDPAKAEQWWRQAAAQGFSRAQSNLGMLLTLPGRTKTQRTEGFMWLLVAKDKETTAEKALEEIEGNVDEKEWIEANRWAQEYRVQEARREAIPKEGL